MISASGRMTSTGNEAVTESEAPDKKRLQQKQVDGVKKNQLEKTVIKRLNDYQLTICQKQEKLA